MASMTHHHSPPVEEIAETCQEIHDSGPDRVGYLLVHIFPSYTLVERLAVIQTYGQMYGEDMISRLRAETKVSEDLCHFLTLWFGGPHARDAIVAWQSLRSGMEVGADYMALVEIYVGRKSSHVLMINQAYAERFGRILEQDIINAEPPSPLKKILVALVASHKAHHEDASVDIAKCDAKRLFETGEGKSGGSVDEAIVLEVFCKRSIPQLKLTFSRYRQIYGHQYTKILKKKNSGEFDNALKMVIRCMCNAPMYYAKLLHASLEGRSPNMNTLARIVASRAEVEMDEIQKVYAENYGRTLLDAISKGMPFGDFRDFILAVVSKTNSKV